MIRGVRQRGEPAPVSKGGAGLPSKASREKGEAILKAAVEELVQLIKERRQAPA